jgi:hypothetical protein
MNTLVTIPGTNALIQAAHLPSLAAAFDELTAAAGFRPVVLGAPSDGIPGGARTLAQSQIAGSGTLSDHYADNARGYAAVDIDNQRAFRNRIGSAAFEAILAKHGWRNIQINGAPFPNEPWHFARHVSEGAASPSDDGTRWDQTRLNAYGYGLVVDGVKGPKTTAAIRDFQAKHGLVVDGIAGPATDRELAKSPSASLTVDGVWGRETTRALQAELGVKVDGVRGRETDTALQVRIGTPADGDFGPNSRKALQAYLGVEQDGNVGPITVRALQTRLNAGTF